jgi:hypothetical protein
VKGPIPNHTFSPPSHYQVPVEYGKAASNSGRNTTHTMVEWADTPDSRYTHYEAVQLHTHGAADVGLLYALTSAPETNQLSQAVLTGY